LYSPSTLEANGIATRSLRVNINICSKSNNWSFLLKYLQRLFCDSGLYFDT
jgi:hypothetical protein